MLTVAILLTMKRSGLLKNSAVLMVAFAVALLLANPPALGQSTFGSILGSVRDSSGQSVVGATVSVVNRGTTAKRSVTSDQSGDYSFLNLEPGQYELTIEAG